MRIVAAALALVALGAAAQGLEEFRDRAPIALTSKAPLHRVALPEAAYRDTRADLADIRIFNGRGEPVPIALAAEPDAARESSPPMRLAAFPLTSLGAAPATSRVKVQLADGTWLAIDTDARSAAAERRVVAYLIDASGLKQPVHALLLDWEVLPAQEAIRVRVEASDDLREWRAIGEPVSLMRIEHEGRKLEQPRIPLLGSGAKYLRVVALDAPFTLKTAFAEFQERAAPTDLTVKRIAGKPGSRAGEAVYDLEGRLPVEAVRIVPGEPNSVIAAAIFLRDTAEGTPSWVAQGTFYRMAREGAEIESPAMAIRRRAARYWIVRTDPVKGGYGATPPELEVHWRPAQVVFVARGDEPFTLAFGDREAKSALLPVASLIPGYETHAEMKLPEAKAGAVSRNAAMQDEWPAWLQDIPPRKLALWAVLLGAVALLGFMAWRLRK